MFIWNVWLYYVNIYNISCFLYPCFILYILSYQEVLRIESVHVFPKRHSRVLHLCFLSKALWFVTLKRRRKLYSTHLIGKDALMFGFDLRKLCYWILLLHLYNFLKPLHFRSNEDSPTWLIYTHNMGAIKSRIVHIPFCLSLVCQEKSTILWKAEGKYWKRINGAQHRDGLIVPVGRFYHLYVALH